MRKFSGLLILILSVIATLVFFVLLNLSFFTHENRLKSILSEGNFYDTAALYIKNEIVTKSDFKLNEGSNFEELNQKITALNVKPIIDETIHNIFTTLNDPNAGARIFPIKFDSQNDSGLQFSFEKYVNLQQNKIFDIFAQRNYYLLLAAAGLFVLLLIGIFIYSSKTTDRFAYIFIYCLLTLIFLSIAIVLLKFYLPNYIDPIVDQSQLFKEPKLVATAKKLVTTIINKQAFYYLAEILGFLILTVTMLSIKNFYAKEKLGKIEEKI